MAELDYLTARSGWTSFAELRVDLIARPLTSRGCDGRALGGGLAGTGKAQYGVGVTDLALLAFLKSGSTDRSDGPFGKVVASGLLPTATKWVWDTEAAFPKGTWFLFTEGVDGNWPR